MANVTTPTIFLVGENDERGTDATVYRDASGAEEHGVPTHLYVAPREGHGWRELRHVLFKANAELAWFEEHVTEREYVWEEAPKDKTEEREEKLTAQQ